MGTRVMTWWRARVVAPVRRACRLAAAAAHVRVRKGECGVLNLRQDVQSCGYHDVQVMWEMLSFEKEAAPAVAAPTKQQQRRKRPFLRLPPSFRPARSPRAAAAQ